MSLWSIWIPNSIKPLSRGSKSERVINKIDSILFDSIRSVLIHWMQLDAIGCNWMKNVISCLHNAVCSAIWPFGITVFRHFVQPNGAITKIRNHPISIQPFRVLSCQSRRPFFVFIVILFSRNTHCNTYLDWLIFDSTFWTSIDTWIYLVGDQP